MQQKTASRTSWIDYLRSFITVLVVAHHAALAYTTFATFHKEAYILSTHPIVDTKRSVGMDLFVIFNDSFFMALMFLISGVFALKTLQNKGAKHFIKERFKRLFIPFLASVTLVNLIAYYPAYLSSDKPAGLFNYVYDFFTIESWPVGPAWFIWVLFLYHIILALIYPVLSPSILKLKDLINQQKGGTFVFIFICLTWLLMVPMILLFGAESWTGIGPFDFQKSRVLLYGGYFLIGCFGGIDLFEGPLFKKPFGSGKSIGFILIPLLLFLVLLYSRQPIQDGVAAGKFDQWQATLIYYSLFSCLTAVTNLSFLYLFKHFIEKNNAIWSSLSANAYDIYLVHYLWITWCQYLLLSIELPATLKFLIVFFISLSGSWASVSLLRYSFRGKNIRN